MIFIFGATAFVFADSTGTVNAEEGLYIRTGAGTSYDDLDCLPFGTVVTIKGEATASDGVKWYHVSTSYGGGYTGYVCSYYITVGTGSGNSSSTGHDVSYSTDADFEEYLTAQEFPESYKPYLRSLHASYPNWRFIAMHTGLDWTEVIYRETHPVSRSLVPNSWSDSWKSREAAAFDAATGKYYIFDSGGYVAANSYGVAYYMDPRNNLGPETIFQFMSNKFDASTQTLAGVQAIADGTYLASRKPGGDYASYAELIYDVGKATGVNPLTIASMLIVEQGTSGGTDSISGVCPGYEGYYNFFHIGAYASGGRSAQENGLIYAKSKGWDSPYKSILGGAEIYANNYVYNNKSTLYFKKYNVMNGMSNVGTGQYMTAIYGAATEGKMMAEGYQGLLNGGISFEIPVYENMPASACPLPTTIDIPPREESNNSGGSSSSSSSSSSSESSKQTPAPATPTISSGSYKVGTNITGVPAGTTVSSLVSNMAITNGTAKVVDAGGKEVASGSVVGTGVIVKVYDSTGAEKSSYPVVIKGDNNGDGKVNSADALRTQRHSIGSLTLSGAAIAAYDINGDGKYNSADALLMQRFSIGTYTISW